jgi:hypothetical protein
MQDGRGWRPSPWLSGFRGSIILPKNPLGTAMQQIADWLEKLGMSEYTDQSSAGMIRIALGGPSNASAVSPLTAQRISGLG